MHQVPLTLLEEKAGLKRWLIRDDAIPMRAKRCLQCGVNAETNSQTRSQVRLLDGYCAECRGKKS